MKIRTYSELSKLTSFKERYEYLKLNGKVGETTFGYDRWLNQIFYKSKEWRQLRNEIIIRDRGFDLGIEGYEITSGMAIHHMNPITVNDILDRKDVLNPEYLICVSSMTHKAIHYGDSDVLIASYPAPVTRRKNDTCPWK